MKKSLIAAILLIPVTAPAFAAATVAGEQINAKISGNTVQ